MHGKIYITYSESPFKVEENAALRLQTLSNLYGINVSLPYRLNRSTVVDPETKARISDADYVVVFSVISASSAIVHKEIEYSLSLNKPIIVIYDKTRGKNLKIKKHPKVQEVYLDIYNSDDNLSEIAGFLQQQLKSSAKVKNDNSGLGIALLGIGLGLLALALFSDDR